jgi:hypothetical protein
MKKNEIDKESTEIEEKIEKIQEENGNIKTRKYTTTGKDKIFWKNQTEQLKDELQRLIVEEKTDDNKQWRSTNRI